MPDLATRFKHSRNLKTWWFWLRHNVKYANGRQFTAADVVANVLHNLDPKVPSLWGPAIKDVRSVRAISKYEVRFRLGGPSAILPEALVPVEMADLTDVSKLNTVGNGTGPYKVSDFVPDQSLTLVPNAIYYGPKACMQKIVFETARDIFEQMQPSWRGDREDLLGQVIHLVEEFVQSDRITIHPASYNGDDLRRRFQRSL